MNSLPNLDLPRTFRALDWPIIEDMVALMIWLLVVAVIGSLIVVGVLRPARQSGHKASTVFTRRQAERERKRLETPTRSADERLAASGRGKGRARRSEPAAAPRVTPRVRPQAPSVADPVVWTPEPPAAKPTAPAAPVVPAAPAVSASPAELAEPVANADSVIDARTRWSRAEDDVQRPEPPRPSPSEDLRRAE